MQTLNHSASRNRKIIGIIVVIFITLLLAVGLIIPMIVNSTTRVHRNDFMMFTYVTDFEQIAQNHGFEMLSPEEDRHLGGLNYIEKSKIRFRAHGRTYSIFAYVFVDDNEAEEYFSRVSGRSRASMERDIGWRMHGSGNTYFRHRIAVQQGNKVFQIRGQNIWSFNDMLRLFFSELNEPLLSE